MHAVDNYDLAIIFPCYNEASRVSQTVTVYRDYLLSHPQLSQQKIVLVLVDDGSTDQTGLILDSFVGQPSSNLTITQPKSTRIISPSQPARRHQN